VFELLKELAKFQDVFSDKEAGILLRARETDHAINILIEKEPPYRPLYSLSTRELHVLRNYIEKALVDG
jgi:hypothetical protein